ncbi:16S rRNA (uracil(1498)-N(3))-methyltransferase [Petrimonas sp.]|jgi:16S rRNA (uracil1498-N3)-methyltransferase|uniref:16S rRNA (uracil(1498)-N(3))-methyltransferase n=1 Tax=Petrimonas sp. TaxID=2023866 RepID=UPI002B261923|nr:16S rRNA (uracil(1498)-N(3))-methyltransferase [Petrimonas sp.]
MADTFFYSPGIRVSQQLPEQESQHCVKVLRMKEGDKLTVTDGKGFFYPCTLLQAHPKHCIVSIDEEIPRPKSWDFTLHIAFAPTKNIDRIEWFAEKATELGVDRFSPLLCRFSERKELKGERVEKIVVSAMKQSQQAVMPIIDPMIPFRQFAENPFTGRKFIAHCRPDPNKMALAKTYRKGEDALILIGPEGDFSEEEVQQALDLGFEPVSLGENRLRTETASLLACHTIHVLNAR